MTRRQFVERLEDPTLLEHAVDTGGDLAVPVGGCRRGGYVCVDGEAEASRVIALLAGHPGFPNLRVEVSHDPEAVDNVLWGDEEPSLPPFEASDLDWACSDVTEGRFYGYSEAAIRAYLVWRWGSGYSSRGRNLRF